MDEDATDAAWNQAQLEEQERWEHYRRVNRDYREWLKSEFPNWFLNTHKQEHAND